jgi:hypothetical protein
MRSLLKKSLPLTLLLVLSLVSGLAFAGPGGTPGDRPVSTGTANPFERAVTATCTVATWLQGPVGIAVGFLVLVGGLIAMQVANRDAIPMITRAVIGTALLIGAGATFAAIVTSSGCTATGGGAAVPGATP